LERITDESVRTKFGKGERDQFKVVENTYKNKQTLLKTPDVEGFLKNADHLIRESDA